MIKRLIEHYDYSSVIGGNMNKFKNLAERDNLDLENGATVLDANIPFRLNLLKEPYHLLVFKFSDSKVAVYYTGSEFSTSSGGVCIRDTPLVVDDKYGKSSRQFFSDCSWSKIMNLNPKIDIISFDESNRANRSKLQVDRRDSKKGMVNRVDSSELSELARRYTIDKSGYAVDPHKYDKRLAELQLTKYKSVLTELNDEYSRLGRFLGTMGLCSDRNIRDRLEQLLKDVPSIVRDFYYNLDKYSMYKSYIEDDSDSSDYLRTINNEVKVDLIKNIMKFKSSTKDIRALIDEYKEWKKTNKTEVIDID